MKLSSPSKLHVEFEGTVTTLSYPTVAEQIELKEKIKACGFDQVELAKLQREFLVSKGLPIEIVNRLDWQQFDDLAGELVSPKKK